MTFILNARFDESVTGFIPDEIVLVGDIPVNQVFNGKRKKGFVYSFSIFCFAIGIEPSSFCPAIDILYGRRKNEGRSSEVAIALAACAWGKNTLASSAAGLMCLRC